MKEIKGNYGTAKIFTDNVEESAITQIAELMEQPFIEGATVRVMPDCHPGSGCVIGLTHTISDKIVPSLVGVDLGCGMLYAEIGKDTIDFEKLDKVIREFVPAGQNVHEGEPETLPLLDLLRCKNSVNRYRVEQSLASLGGGNHFISIEKDYESGIQYLLIHTGSRSLGTSIAKHYQNIAIKKLSNVKSESDEIILRLKAEGRQSEISTELTKLKNQKHKFNPAFAYVEGQDMKNYLNDVIVAQQYANLNRLGIADIIASHMGFELLNINTTIHNYIDREYGILRKGAVSARKGEELLIPINMRDGSLICIGKGNPDWNQSAPHGAGRLRSRTASKNLITMEEFTDSMKGIYSTSVNEDTLDESPQAYKPIEEIMENIKDTVDIVKRIIPVYNFKAGN